MLHQAALSLFLDISSQADGQRPPAQSNGRANNQTATEAATDIDVQQVLLVGLLISLILISIVGNCLVCVAIFTDRRLRKLGNAFIVSLAIADLFVSCLVMTFALCNDLMNQWIFGDWFCDVWISFDIMCCTASILNLCAISLDRFVHIKDCLLYNQWMTRRVALTALLCIWFISALVSFVPINLGWHRPPPSCSAPADALLVPPRSSPAPAPSSSSYSAARQAPAELAAHTLSLERQQLAQHRNVSAWPADQFQLPADQDQRRHQQQQQQQQETRPASGRSRPPEELPQCMLTLTPTYAVISSTISFYIPCIIMLGLYTKLFACARKHVKNIQAISKAPAPLGPARSHQHSHSQLQRHCQHAGARGDGQQEKQSTVQFEEADANCSAARRKRRRHRALICGRAWLRLRPQTSRSNARAQEEEEDEDGDQAKRPNAQAINDKLLSLAGPTNQLTKAAGAPQGPAAAAATTEAQLAAGQPISDSAAAAPLAAAGHYGSRDTGYNCGHTDRSGRRRARRGSGSNGAGSSSHNRSGSLLERQLLAGQEEDNQLTQQLTLDQIGAPAGGSIISSGELFQQARPFLASEQQQLSSSSGQLERSESWRPHPSRQQQEVPRLLLQAPKRLQARATSFNSSSSASQQQQQQQQQRGQQLATHKAAVTLGIIMGTFLFCWVPFFCLNIIKAFCVDCIPSSLFRAFTWLGYANSALNPIIYGIHNSEFRHAFNRIFFKHLNIMNSRYYPNRRFSAFDMRHNNSNNNNHHHHRQHATTTAHHNLQQQQQQQLDNHLNSREPATALSSNNNSANANDRRASTGRQLNAGNDFGRSASSSSNSRPLLAGQQTCSSSSKAAAGDGAKSDTVT